MKVMNNKNDAPVSMLQKTWRILAEKFGSANLFVAGNCHHESILLEQLGTEAQVILEPAQRDTFAAISLAASFLVTRKHIDPQETVVVLPVDTYTDPSFYDCLSELDRLIQRGIAPLALIGIAPKYAADKFGYILPRHASPPPSGNFVESFVEKPDMQTAQELIEQGALWNGGVFAFRLAYLQETVTRHQFPWDYRALYSQYDTIPRISFDYMVVEPEKNIVFVPYDGIWTDLGTWSEMVRVLSPESSGLVIKDDNCEGTYVVNQLGIPIIVADVKDAIISAGPDGILVSSIRNSHAVKPLVDKLAKPV